MLAGELQYCLESWVDTTKRRRAQERLERLNTALRALHSVNQVLVSAEAPARLVQRACESLVRAGACQSAWAVLVGQDRRAVECAEAGWGAAFGPLAEKIRRAELPACAREVLDSGGPVVADAPASMCSGCPLAQHYQDRAGVALRLAHGDGLYGVLAVSVRGELAADQEWRGVLQEVAGDIAVALHGMEADKERRRAQEALQSSGGQLRALAARLESVREEERRRIARTIRREVAPALAGLKMNLALLGKRVQWADADARPAVGRIESMSRLLDGAMGCLRKLALDLRPGVLDLGLSAALEWQIEEFKKATGLRCEFISPQEDPEVDEPRSAALFRIFQEILSNIARHARASKLSVKLEVRGGELLLEVADDGIGVSEADAASRGSLGILAMRERALALGGRLSITGAPGKGTVVTMRMPLG